MNKMDVVELAEKLVEIESTDPGTYEFDVEKFIKSFIEDLKSNKVEIKESEVIDGRKNIMAVFKSGQTKKKIENKDFVLICHMDTVVAGNDWTYKPFSTTKKGERLYGRGFADMKSGLAVALKTFEYAVKNIDAKKMIRDFKVIFTVDEEANMLGVEKVIKDGWVSSKSLVADLEPTDKMIQVSHKGRFWVKLHVKGKTAHASRPELGIDANICLAELISYIRKEIDKLPVDGEIGNSTVTFGMMGGGYEPYVVPDESFATIDFRLAPPTYNHDIIKIINVAIMYVKKEIANDVVVRYEITGDREFVKKNNDSVLLNSLKDVLKTLHDEEKSDDYIPVATSFPGYTDTAVIASRLKNKETLSYGPGSLAQAHKPDEYVDIKDIERCEKVYISLVNKLLMG